MLIAPWNIAVKQGTIPNNKLTNVAGKDIYDIYEKTGTQIVGTINQAGPKRHGMAKNKQK